MTKIMVKRVYEPPAADGGCRVLVDRLWPRGISKDRAAINHWFKELAPSTTLRHWFGHDPDKWGEFQRRYHTELKANKSAVEPLRQLLKTENTITLLFGARDETHNNAVVLAAYLRAR